MVKTSTDYVIFYFIAVTALGVSIAMAQPLPEPEGDITPTHDPVLIREGDIYYSYATGFKERVPLLARRSADLIHWQQLPGPLDKLPQWSLQLVSGAVNAWAPDIAYVDGRYRLYYSVSTFGSRQSAIGLVSSPTLDPEAPDYGWRDDGPVVTSTEADDHNAIDPNFVIDRDGRHWLAFGSFWSGLKLIELDRQTGKPLTNKLIPIARRTEAQGWAIEAPFIVSKNGWYWLIASAGYCCLGIDSTYHLIVGRSKDITGPYVDRRGMPMLEGGGTVLLRADPKSRLRWLGPGHAGHLRDSGGMDYLIYHAYDRLARGKPTLRISRIGWGADGWPQIQN